MQCDSEGGGTETGWEKSDQGSWRTSSGCRPIRKPIHKPLVHRHCQHSIQLTHKQLTTPCASSLCTPWKTTRMSLCRCLVSMCRKLAQLSGYGRKHTNLSIHHHPGESKLVTLNNWPGFQGSREDMKSK